jgi:DNA-3-methyladenine glycosylase II
MRTAVRHLKKCDPVLRGLIERVGPCRLEYRRPDFEALARSIVYQQISGNVASAILGRLGEAVRTPQGVLALTDEAMRGAGLSRQKTAYLRDLAERTASGEVSFRRLPRMNDDQVIAHLTRVKGIGVWTAQMFLLFALERPDVLPTGDLGVKTAVQRAYGLEALPTPVELTRIAEPWRPYASVASWYLWRSLEGPAEI